MGGARTPRTAAPRDLRTVATVVSLLLMVASLVTLPPAAGAASPNTPTPAAQWSSTTIDLGRQLTDVSCLSTQFCEAVDEAGNAVTLSSGAWGQPTPVTTSPMTSVSCATDSFCVAVDQSGEAAVFQQGAWGAPTTVDPSQDLVSVSCPSTQFCAAVDSGGSVVTFNGTSWDQPEVIDAGSSPSAISCSGATMCEAVDGSGNVISLTGSVWTEDPYVDRYGFVSVTCPTATYCMASDGSRMLTFNGTSWTTLSGLSSTIQSISCPTMTFCAMATSVGIFTQTNGIFTDGYPQAVGATALPAISCSSASFCVAVGAGQAYTYAGSALNTPVVIDSHPLTGVSCTSAAFCMAVDSSGQAVPFAAPTWGSPQVVDGTFSLTGVSCSGTWCIAVDTRGDALTYQGGIWSAPVPVGGVSDFTGVSCASTGSCVATDSLGSVVILTGSIWSVPVDLDGTTRLTGVSCSAPTSCVVVDSTAAGHSFTLTGSTWSPAIATGDPNPIESISCASTTYCLAADIYGSESVFDGSTWSAPILSGPTDPTAVSCTSPTSCAAVGNDLELSFDDGSASTYPQSLGINYEDPSGISCVPSLCAVVDNQGKVTTVVDAGSSVTASASQGATAGSPVTYTADVSGDGAAPAPPTGSVSFVIGGVTQCSATVAAGSASCTSTSAPAGSDIISAIYGGDSTLLASDAPPITLSVVPAPGQPSVIGVGPTSGCAVGGSQVTITGTNFTGATAVDFGATPSSAVTVTGPDTLMATVPAGSGVVDVTVSNPAGVSATTAADQFAYGPVVTGLSGSEPLGNALGGDTLHISGSGFTGATAIDIGGQPAASFQVEHDWAAQAVTTPGSGVLDVTVTVGDCTSQITPADEFWAWPIVTGISPTTGVLGGGTDVTLTGAGFTGATSVDFGTTPSPSFQVMSDTEIVAVSPPASYKENLPVTVVTPMGAGIDQSNVTFAYDPYPPSGPPTITSFAPATGRAGTSVTVTGTNFGDTTSVEFGATPAWFQVDSGTTLTTVVPDGGESGPVTVTGTNGTATSAGAFVLTDPSTVLPTSTCSQVVTDPTLAQVYVACGSTVSAFDDSGNLLATIPDLPEVDSMVVLGNHLYVHLAGSGSIAVIDTGSFAETQVFATGLIGYTSMVQASGKLWALSGGTLNSVDPSTGATVTYTNRYFPDLGSTGLRPDPAHSGLLYDLDGFSTIDVGVNPPTVSVPETLGSTEGSIGSSADGLVTTDGSHILVTAIGAAEYDIHDPYGPTTTYTAGTNDASAVALSSSVDGGLVAVAEANNGLQTVALFGPTGAQLLGSVSFGDVDSTIPARCLAISPDGTDLFAVTETDGTAAFHAVPLILPAAAPAFTGVAQAHVVVGEASSVTVSTSGSPSATLTESGALPPGLTFAPETGGEAALMGTPAAGSAGSYPMEITATNPSGSTTEQLTVIVDPVPTITSPSTAAFTVDDEVYFPLSASGSPAPALTESGTLPEGLTFTDNGDGTGSISGSPSIYSGGQYPVTVTADNGLASPSTQTLVITVTGPAAITSPANGEVVQGLPADLTVSSAGWPRPALSLSGTLPSGLHFTDHGNGTGSIAGTASPGTAGTYQLNVRATSASSSASQTFALTVATPPSITSADQANFTDNKYGSFTVTAAGYPAPTVSVVGSLPRGLSVTTGTAGTATISGTPGNADRGSYRLLVEAINGVSPVAEQILTMYAGPVRSVPPTIVGVTSASFTAGKSGTYKLKATGSPTPTISLSGTLPSGLAVTISGSHLTVAGTPPTSADGIYALTVNGANAAGTTTQAVLLTVGSAPAITSAPQTTFPKDTSGQFDVTAVGGYPGPIVLSVIGTLPTGVTFVDDGGGVGLLSGVPTGSTHPAYSLKIEARNGWGTTTQKFHLKVAS